LRPAGITIPAGSAPVGHQGGQELCALARTDHAHAHGQQSAHHCEGQIEGQNAAREGFSKRADERGVQVRPEHLLELHRRRALVPMFRIVQRLCVPKTSSVSCDQAIFVEQATDASLFSDAVLAEVDWLG
jgi:hypothetical protein